jgi:hypothetical protein
MENNGNIIEIANQILLRVSHNLDVGKDDKFTIGEIVNIINKYKTFITDSINTTVTENISTTDFNPNQHIGKIIEFKPNDYKFYQDFRTKYKIPNNVEFKIVDVSHNKDYKLIGDGYGNLEVEGKYGNGAIYVEERIILEVLNNNKPEKILNPLDLEYMLNTTLIKININPNTNTIDIEAHGDKCHFNIKPCIINHIRLEIK